MAGDGRLGTVPAQGGAVGAGRCLLVAGPLLLALVLACAQRPLLVDPDPATREIEAQVLHLTNAYRRSRSLPLLREDPLLAKLARGHSDAMSRGRTGLGHEGLRSRFQTARASAPLVSIGENVARTRRTRARSAAWVVSRWIESDRHRKQLDGPFELIGVGVVRGPSGDLYFTQIFAEAAAR